MAYHSYSLTKLIFCMILCIIFTFEFHSLDCSFEIFSITFSYNFFRNEVIKLALDILFNISVSLKIQVAFCQGVATDTDESQSGIRYRFKLFCKCLHQTSLIVIISAVV